MKRWMATAGVLGALAVNAGAAGGPLGLGVVIGEPTGITGKYYLDGPRQYAVDMGAAWSLSGANELHIYGDYLFHQYQWLQQTFRVTRGKLPMYFGVGGRVKFKENADDKVGIRIPVGMAYQIEGAPLEVFGELVPIVDLAPDTDLAFNGGVGIRFFF